MKLEKDIIGLLKASAHGDWPTNSHARSAIKTFGADATDQLIAALSDRDWQVRREAVSALLAIGGLAIIEPLTKALRDADADVRVEAALALGKIGDLSVLPELEQMAQHDKGLTRHHLEPATMFAKEAIDEIRLRHSGSAIP